MVQDRVKVSSIINNQLPEFVRSEFPLVQEFLTQYYRSLESNGNPYDLMNNIDQYVKVDNISNLTKETTLTQSTTLFDTNIFVSSTAGFPEKFGIIQINDEIIVYESKTPNSFENCYRGFSGVTSYNSNTLLDELEFSSTEISEHNTGDSVKNLNALLLSEFFNKIKKQITPGFENREFYSDLNEKLFIKESNSFYISKGTSESFRILFAALYGKPVNVILPKDFLLEPSDAQYRVTKDIVVEIIDGNPLNLVNKTLYEDSNGARGTITNVEKITRFNNTTISTINQSISEKSSKSIVKDYYILSLDYDYDKDIEVRGSILSEFKIHPKTKLVSTAVSGQSYLDVDSTIGFKSSGTLLIDLENGSSINVTYKSKSLTQFFECSGIDRTIDSGEEIKSDDYAYAIDEDSEIKVRITGVISEIDTSSSHNLILPGSLIQLKSLGKSDSNDIRMNNWIFNIASKYDVQNVNLISPGEYLLTTYDDNDFKIGDNVYLESYSVVEKSLYKNGEVLSVNGREVLVLSPNELVTDGSEKYTIHRKLSKLSISGKPNLSIYNSNISNVYYDPVENFTYIACSSLPNYGGESIKINDFSLNIKSFGEDINNNGLKEYSIIKFNKPHLFLTGDNVIVKLNSKNEQIVGFVKKISNTEIKLSENKDSILSNNFIDFSKYSISGLGKVEFLKFNELNSNTGIFITKEIQPQKLIRKLSNPVPYGREKYPTSSGPVGIFLNGVEIQNYKSEDYLYYGPIERVDVLSGGFGYDVINPPEISFSDPIGSGASAFCSVVGSLERIDIINPGFNYLETPKIEIIGGNGIGAKAEASLISYDHIVKVGVGTLTVNNDQITFDTPHNFFDSEEVIYEPVNSTAITGLSTNSIYFVKVVDINTIKLSSTFDNYASSVTIPISVSGNLGVHQFRSVNKKRRIGKIKILEGGLNYTNRNQVIGRSGINTANSTITIKNHGFKSGEIISYTPDTEPISGITTSNYYVKVLDDNTFRLYEISEQFNSDFIFQSDQYINLTSSGGEKHYFNYPKIEVKIEGKYQVPSLRSVDEGLAAQVQPIFRGEIKSIFLSHGGKNYGTEEIINYQKQPEVTFNSGSGAQVNVIILNGRIEYAYVSNSGFGYNSPPNLIINGSGRGALLTPIISDGRLVDVKIISSGGGYDKNNTSVDVLSAGEEAKVFSNIKSWNISLPERVPSLDNSLPGLTFDDGVLVPSKYGYGIQYSHLYAPRELRKILNDLTYVNGFEVDSVTHSPIIGWAYDGNPIYGPYGFSNPDSTGGIRMMKSGYSIKRGDNRPKNYPNGFFVEDYVFIDDGDLDEHNGRFCITPEFPNGTYAYFATFDNARNSGYKIPKFPYLIGNYYKSTPINFNFINSSNQDSINLNDTNWVRNTYPYNQSKNNSGYEYFLNSADFIIDSKIKTVSAGSVENINILNSGEKYSVNDKIIFDNDQTGGKSASAFISKIAGVAVTQISSSNLVNIKNIELQKTRENSYVGYSSTPHNISNSTFINIYTNNENPQYQRINVTTNNLILNSGIGTIGSTGICTFINVSGNFDVLKTNDIYKIGNEKIKIIGINNIESRIRILRSQDGTSGNDLYNAGTKIIELPRRFEFKFQAKNLYNDKINKEIYFDPAESIGFGSSSGVGINSTIYFSNVGVGQTFITIPTRTIYLPNHGLNSGDSIIYNSNGGNSIVVSPNSGDTLFALQDTEELFVTKITNDLVGISTVRLGINSEGIYSGIGTISGDLLYFIENGTNSYHSFKTNYPNVLNAEVSKNVVTVSTAETHGISLLDDVYINVESNSTKEIIVKYNEYNRRLVIDPLRITSVNILNNSLIIENNNLKQGEKIIFEEIDEISGMTNNSIYYVSLVNSEEFRLSTSKYNLKNNIYVNIESGGDGYISKINPEINIIKYEKIKFNLSDKSLSYFTGGFSRQPSFRFELFYDRKHSDKLYPLKNEDSYTLIENGIVGSTEDAYVLLELNENSNKEIYYKLSPINSDSNPENKKQIIIDDEQINYCQIKLIDSLYNGKKSVIGVSTNTFSYEVKKYPEKSSYDLESSQISYKTDSNTALGPIGEIKIKNGGYGYRFIPSVSVVSNTGINGQLYAVSSSIGMINSIDLQSIGYNYSCDLTIKPSVSIPTILFVDPFSIFDNISVVDKGFSYTTNSDLVVIDGLTKKLVNDVKLEYSPEGPNVNIIQNTKGISNFIPTLIPINNSNGVGIGSILYDNSTKNVTLFLDSTFSDPQDFPFEVGSRIFIEGCNIKFTDSKIIEKNYNSSQFDYALFELIEVNPNIGFYGASITYNISSYLNSNESMGYFDNSESTASVIPEVYFPKFEINLKKNNFTVGEKVISNKSIGIIDKWDSKSGILVVSTKDKFNINTIIVGETSKSSAIIISEKHSECFAIIKSNSIVDKLWNTEKGFLNNDFQRLHDNNYYQYFSYDLKSEIPIDTWEDVVSSLNHTSGFKKFSTLSIQTSTPDSRIDTNQNEGAIGAIYNADGIIDLDCVYNFDLTRENVLILDSNYSSNKIFFNSRKIQDYVLSIGNKVLILDDISDQFSNEIRPENYSIIDEFSINNIRYSKYFIRSFDRRFFDESEFSIVSILNDGTNSYIEQYGKLYSKEDLGFFSSDSGRVLFYPNKFNYNDYTVCHFSFSIGDSQSGISTIFLGDSAIIQSYSSPIPKNTSVSTPIVSISSTFRSIKVNTLLCNNDDEEYSYVELNLIHDGVDVYITEYGNLETTFTPTYSGIGTFDSYISGSNVIVSFTPNVSTSTTYFANSLVIGVGDTSTTGIGTEEFINSYFESGITSITASPTPIPIAISSYFCDNYTSSYNIVSIEDLTNNQYKFCEILTDYNFDLDNLGEVEYGVVTTGENLGIITCGVDGVGFNKKVILYFTPNENVNYQVRVFKLVMGSPTEFDESKLGEITLKEDIGFYFGRFNNVKKSFDLTHNGNKVFEKIFDGSSLNDINIDEDTISVPNHYFVTGEKITYNLGGKFGSPIGIAETNISGIGITDKLPSTLYAIKLDDLKIRVSASASEALKPIPTYLDLTSVGVSNNHIFYSEKQNSKSLISIDNIIQSPVVSTSNTTFLLNDFTKLSSIITIDDPLQISGGDYLKIDDEIVKVAVVGYGGSFNNVLVDRQYLGTLIDNHSSGAIVTKIEANYNIVGNTINFADAPKGRVPQENILNPEEVDFDGLKTKSTFSGRVFLRSGVLNTDITPYKTNYVFDTISDKFDGTTESFNITSEFENVSEISSNNFITLVRNIFQLPERNSPKPIEGDYSLSENLGITSIRFKPNSNTVDYDINVKNIPRGGIIVSVGSTEGFGYQPLVAAGGTAVVSSSGTISSISIGNSGSGYRCGIQTTINVGVKTLSDNINYIGTADCNDGHIVSVAITNPGVGYTSYYEVIQTNTIENISSGSTILYLDSTNTVEIGNLVTIDGYLNRVSIISVASTFVTIGLGDTISSQINLNSDVLIEKFNPPTVIFDSPLSYSDIPLIYSSSTPQSGFGTEATIDLVVSQDSSVLSFEIKNYGYGYNKDDILTIGIGGSVGIPTDNSLPLKEFQLTIDKVYDDQFASWHLGKLLVIDPIDDLIDGKRRFFPIRIDGKQISFEVKSGSNLNLSGNLIIFINDILQIPGESYIFDGGSTIEFLDPPPSFDDLQSGILNVTKTKILFYGGTDGIDTKNIDILETVKVGDTVRLDSDNINYKQNSRIVNEIISSDSIRTNLYSGRGVSDNEKLLRNTIWCKQKDDIFLSNVGFGKSTNNYIISKARESYEPYINPSSYLIKNVSIGDTEIFVDNLQTFFNSFDEVGTVQDEKYRIIKISSQDNISSCYATPVVSSSGTISSIIVNDGGFGYDTIPNVIISPPIGLGITCTASATLSDTSVIDISVNNGGNGYSQLNPPSVLVESPVSKSETIGDAIYEGDFGIITGISTISIGMGFTGIVFEFFIPENSYIRNSEITGAGATNISGIQSGYYFVVRNSNVGNGLISLNENGETVGFGVTFIDNVYVASNVSIAETTVVGVGTTQIAQVTVRVSDYNGLTSVGQTYYYGSYSWGRISNLTRTSPKEFITYKNGVVGIESSPIVQRYHPLKNDLYSS